VEALYGTEGEERDSLRDEFRVFVDEGRGELRRPEFSGEMPRGFHARMGALLGAGAAISTPVLGPDEFVKNAYSGEVAKQRERLSVGGEVGIGEVCGTVCAALGIESALLSMRTRARPVSRARALVAWLWVERLGRPQVALCEEFHVGSSGVARMLDGLRRKGASEEESRILNETLRALAAYDDIPSRDDVPSAGVPQPHFFLLRRQREGNEK
jgi:hypothetical protein